MMMGFKEFLEEKLILYNNGAKYGQVVFLAGGSASGKSFSVQNYMEGEKFKVRDIDAWNDEFIKLNQLKHQYPELDNINLRNPADVFKIHQFVKQKGIKTKTMDLLLGGAKNPSTLPNIIFDMVFDSISDVNTILPSLFSVGYKPENIHITWILANYSLAVQNNKSRSRIVPDDIILKSHEGAARTMWDIIKNRNVPNGINGEIRVVLSNQATFYDDKHLLIKDFPYILVKHSGKPIMNSEVVQRQLFDWVVSNVPKTFLTKHMFRS